MGNKGIVTFLLTIKGYFRRLIAASPVPIGIVKLDPRATPPTQATPLAAGWDVTAALLDAPIVIQPGERTLIKLGFALELPPNMEAQVRPRSGWALKAGITVLNSPGTIDADYKGECGVILVNHGKESFTINPGDRVAQLIFAPVPPVVVVEHANQTSSNRGTGGFGSTGR